MKAPEIIRTNSHTVCPEAKAIVAWCKRIRFVVDWSFVSNTLDGTHRYQVYVNDEFKYWCRKSFHDQKIGEWEGKPWMIYQISTGEVLLKHRYLNTLKQLLVMHFVSNEFKNLNKQEKAKWKSDYIKARMHDDVLSISKSKMEVSV